ncbi:MAG TPA: nucleotidyltransferase family protein [Lacipirellulaceae bacterium]|nr:nucleotidyltransferase family protein [Lacipirellulaceae bacterium]
MASVQLQPLSWERIIGAVERVRARLDRAVAALDEAGIPYAVIGGHAVAAWVSRVDEAAVRNTQDVDILLRRDDLERAKVALSALGFVFRHDDGVDMFLGGPKAKARDAIHIVFSGEKVNQTMRPSARYERSRYNRSVSRGRYRAVDTHEPHLLSTERPGPFARHDRRRPH